ncbi:glycosyltransferase family 2 protein [Deferribacterales bacterium RsTz2092]|nr:glycosyl hydrolase [Deferribacterales bacterium]
MKLITILVPCYNEEQAVRLFHKRLCATINTLSASYDFEILFINDGSIDETANIIRELQATDNRVAYVSLSRNFGKEVALLAGFDYAKGDAVVTIDADLQHPPEIIPDMLKLWESGYADVYAERISRDTDSFFRKIATVLYYKVLKNIADEPLDMGSYDFRLLDRRCINALCELRELCRYTKGLFSWIGYRKISIPYEVAPRVAGEASYTLIKRVHLAIDGVLSSSILPLRVASFCGVAISMFAFIYLVITLITTLVYGNPTAGWTSTLVIILFGSSLV